MTQGGVSGSGESNLSPVLHPYAHELSRFYDIDLGCTLDELVQAGKFREYECPYEGDSIADLLLGREGKGAEISRWILAGAVLDSGESRCRAHLVSDMAERAASYDRAQTEGGFISWLANAVGVEQRRIRSVFRALRLGFQYDVVTKCTSNEVIQGFGDVVDRFYREQRIEPMTGGGVTDFYNYLGRLDRETWERFLPYELDFFSGILGLSRGELTVFERWILGSFVGGDARKHISKELQKSGCQDCQDKLVGVYLDLLLLPTRTDQTPAAAPRVVAEREPGHPELRFIEEHRLEGPRMVVCILPYDPDMNGRLPCHFSRIEILQMLDEILSRTAGLEPCVLYPKRNSPSQTQRYLDMAGTVHLSLFNSAGETFEYQYAPPGPGNFDPSRGRLFLGMGPNAPAVSYVVEPYARDSIPIAVDVDGFGYVYHSGIRPLSVAQGLRSAIPGLRLREMGPVVIDGGNLLHDGGNTFTLCNTLKVNWQNALSGGKSAVEVLEGLFGTLGSRFHVLDLEVMDRLALQPVFHLDLALSFVVGPNGKSVALVSSMDLAFDLLHRHGIYRPEETLFESFVSTPYKEAENNLRMADHKARYIEHCKALALEAPAGDELSFLRFLTGDYLEYFQFINNHSRMVLAQTFKNLPHFEQTRKEIQWYLDLVAKEIEELGYPVVRVPALLNDARARFPKGGIPFTNCPVGGLSLPMAGGGTGFFTQGGIAPFDEYMEKVLGDLRIRHMPLLFGPALGSHSATPHCVFTQIPRPSSI